MYYYYNGNLRSPARLSNNRYRYTTRNGVKILSASIYMPIWGLRKCLFVFTMHARYTHWALRFTSLVALTRSVGVLSTSDAESTVDFSTLSSPSCPPSRHPTRLGCLVIVLNSNLVFLVWNECWAWRGKWRRGHSEQKPDALVKMLILISSWRRHPCNRWHDLGLHLGRGVQNQVEQGSILCVYFKWGVLDRVACRVDGLLSSDSKRSSERCNCEPCPKHSPLSCPRIPTKRSTCQ